MEVEQYPPAPGGHVQEELHVCQQVVVVIRRSTQGTAQLPELWGERSSRWAFQRQAPPTLTSPPAHSAGRPGEQREGHGGQVRGAAWSLLGASEVRLGLGL